MKFDNWKDACERFSAHEKCLYHIRCAEVALNASRVVSSKQLPVILQIDNEARRQIEENRKSLVPIIETVLLCGRQGLALRGH